MGLTSLAIGFLANLAAAYRETPLDDPEPPVALAVVPKTKEEDTACEAFDVQLHDTLPDGVSETDPDWQRVKLYSFRRSELTGRNNQHGERLRLLRDGSLQVSYVGQKTKPLVLERLDDRHFFVKRTGEPSIVYKCID